ncbi:MAG TPA: ABC transporter permease, partial [Verrucomicrobiae bacterium]|nr:ABC transporter permease [Verrucomicrobiae bacterium]
MHDLKFALRQLIKSPGFTAVAIISLALGIGSSTAVFSLANAILLRSLPVPNPRELRVVQWSGSDVNMSSFEGTPVVEGNRWVEADCFTHPAFLHLRERSAKQADLFGFYPIQEAVAGVRGETFIASGAMVSDNFFAGLEVQPDVGRLLQPGEDYTTARSAVISHDWWEKHFNANPLVIGQPVTLSGVLFTIVGVLPRGFSGVSPGKPSEFYVPMAAGSPFLYRPINETFHWFVHLMARMKPGVSDTQLRAALDIAFTQEAAPLMKAPSTRVEPGRGGPAGDRNNYGKPLRLMLGVVGLVMLVACANLAGLSLARGAAREHELAVRAALGSGRWRLIRQSLTESFVLALAGGGVGVMIALWGRAAISRLLAGSAAGLRYDFSLDFTVLLFGLALALLTAVLSGLLPSLRASRIDPIGGLKSRGALGAPRLRAGRILVAAQICLSLLLLTGAGLYARTLVNLTRIDAGFNVDRLLLVGLNIQSSGAATTRGSQFYDRALSAVSAVPGV